MSPNPQKLRSKLREIGPGDINNIYLTIYYVVIWIIFSSAFYIAHRHMSVFKISTNVFAIIIGFTLNLWSVAFYLSAKKALGDNWSPMPKKIDGGILVHDGPYQYVRHPIYFAIILFIVSLSIMTFSISTILLLALVIAVLIPKAFVEEKLLVSIFGDEYAQYKQKVPFVFPYFNNILDIFYIPFRVLLS